MNVFAKLKKLISAKMLAGFFMASVALFMVAPVTLQIQEIEVQNTISKKFNVATNINIAYAEEDGTSAPAACGSWFNTIKALPMCSMVWILWAVFWVSAQFVKFSGWILDIILSYTLESFTYNNQQGWITQGWALIRDFINVFFIMILLTIAGNMLVNKGGDTWKKQLISIALAAIMINFSLFFVKVVIDAGNITSRVFYRAMDLQENDIPAVQGGTAKLSETEYPVKVRSITAAVIVKTNAMNLLSAIGGSNKSLGVFATDWVLTFVYLIIGIGLYIFMTYMFLNIAFYFFARTIGLWFLMVLSPLAFLASVNIPWLKKIFDAPAMKEVGFESYAANLAKMAFQPAIFLFMMYLTIVALNLFVFAVPNSKITLSSSNGDSFFIEIIYWLIPLIVTFGLIIATKKATDKFSTTFGNFIASGAKSVVGTVGGLLMGGTGRFARATLGQGISKAIGDRGEKAKIKALENMATGKGSYLMNKALLFKGNALSGAKKSASEGGWDVRDLEGKLRGGLNKYGNKVGLDFNTGVDFNSSKIGLAGLGSVDVGKISLPSGYTLAGEKGIFEEGRKGGFGKHGKIVEEYYKGIGEEWLKVRTELDEKKLEKIKKDTEKAKKDVTDAEKDIIDIGFNGDEKIGKQKIAAIRKARKLRDNFDGGYKKESLDYFTEKSSLLVNSYRLKKTSLSSVVEGMSKSYTHQKTIFEARLRELAMLPQTPENQEKIDQTNDLIDSLNKEYSLKRGMLFTEYDKELARVNTLSQITIAADDPTDTREIRSEKIKKRKEKSDATIEHAKLNNQALKDIITDRTTYTNDEDVRKTVFEDLSVNEISMMDQNNIKYKQRTTAYDAYQEKLVKYLSTKKIKDELTITQNKLAELQATPPVNITPQITQSIIDLTAQEAQIQNDINTQYGGMVNLDNQITAAYSGGTNSLMEHERKRKIEQDKIDDIIDESGIEKDQVKKLVEDLEKKDREFDKQGDTLKGIEKGFKDVTKDVTKKINENATIKKNKAIKTITTISGILTGGLTGAGIGAVATGTGVGAAFGATVLAPTMAVGGYHYEDRREKERIDKKQNETNIKLEYKKGDGDKEKKKDDDKK